MQILPLTMVQLLKVMPKKGERILYKYWWGDDLVYSVDFHIEPSAR